MPKAGRLALTILIGIAGIAATLSFGVVAFAPNSPDTAPIRYPARPLEHPSYLNDSSIREWDPEALFQIERARELTGIEFAMVFVRSIPTSYTAERYAAELFDEWRIGEDADGKGVLFLFIEDRSTLKIEVAYELEGTFPDAFCNGFQDYIRVYFAGQYFGDVVAHLVLSMVDRYRGNAVDPPRVEYTIDREVRHRYLSGGAGITNSDYFYERDRKLSAVRPMTSRQLAQLKAGSPEESIERYFLSLESGINSPELDVLNEGSRLMRLEYPYPASELRNQARKYRSAPNPSIIREGDLAVARFGDAYVPPLFLRRDPDGNWRIDLVKSWAFTTGDRSLTRFFPLYTDHPWMFAFPEHARSTSRVPIPALLDSSMSITHRIRELESEIEMDPRNAQSYFDLASILYFECYWIRAAINAVERGLELSPDSVRERWLAIAMRYRFPATGGASIHFDHLRRLFPDDRALWEEAIRHERSVIRDALRAREIERELAETMLSRRHRIGVRERT